MSRLLALATCALVLSSCESAVTEVVLVIDSDLATPSQVDSVDITITAPDLTIQTASVSFDDTTPGFVQTLGVSQKDALEDASYAVEVVARKSGVLVVRRRASFSFTTGKRRMLRIELLDDCRGVLCTGGNTCGNGGFCERVERATVPFDADALQSAYDAGM